jgi:hypothetical protein
MTALCKQKDNNEYHCRLKMKGTKSIATEQRTNLNPIDCGSMHKNRVPSMLHESYLLHTPVRFALPPSLGKISESVYKLMYGVENFSKTVCK